MEILSLILLAVTAGTFLLVAWVAAKRLFFFFRELSVGQSYRPSILATTKMSIAPPRPPPKSRYNKE
jgi:hypothetical protein